MNRSLIPWRRKHKNTQLSAPEEHPVAELYQRMNDLFADFFDGNMGLFRPGTAADSEVLMSMPTFDVSETEKAVEVRAELPGMDEKDIEVTLDENILTVRGEKKQERTENKKNYYLSECRYGEFHRAVPLPAGIDRDHVKAAFKKGVLRITLPKTEEARTDRHRIKIDAD